MTLLLKDGVRYNLWIPDREDKFEEIVKEHVADIFGEDAEFFDIKRKIKSKAGIGSIPDGYMVTFTDHPRWYVVEIELSSHPLYDHIVKQISKFISGTKNPESRREIIDALYDEVKGDSIREARLKRRIGSGEIYRFFSKLISKPPTLVIIIDQKTEELEEVCNTLTIDTEVVEFKTFEREGVGLGVHIHSFEPLFMPSVTPIFAPVIEEKRVGEVIATIGGKRVRVTREDILKASIDPKIARFRYKTTYVEIEGKKYSVKGLISLASGIPSTEFITTQAEGILKKLGFKVFKLKS